MSISTLIKSMSRKEILELNEIYKNLIERASSETSGKAQAVSDIKMIFNFVSGRKYKISQSLSISKEIKGLIKSALEQYTHSKSAYENQEMMLPIIWAYKKFASSPGGLLNTYIS